MADSVSVGSLSTSTGTTRLFGTNSKIDTETLVKAAYEAKRLPAVRLEKKIEQNEAKAAAYDELKTLLTDLKTALNGLRNPPGFYGYRDNLFEAKEAYLSADTATSPGTLMGVDIDPGAATGSFTMKVKQLATAEKRLSAAVAGGSTTLASSWNGGSTFAGELKLGVGGSTERTIAVNGDMKLADLRDAINAASGETGVRANIIKLSDTEHRLTLTATDTGKPITLANGTGDDVLGRMGLVTTQAAQSSKIEVDGVEIERTGNTITDINDGMTISLYRAEPGTTVTVGVEPSLSPIKEGITAFVDAYNAVRAFVERNTALDDSGKAKEDAVLVNDRVLRSIADTLSGFVGESVRGAPSGALATLRDIGISLDENNRLAVDSATLDKQLLADLDGVRGVLEFGFSASSPDVRVTARTNALADTSFALAITDADNDGVFEAKLDGVAAEVDGKTIRGKAGTAYEGLEIAWVGSAPTTIAIEARPGIADRLFNALEEALDTDGGVLQRAADNLTDLNETYTQQIATIDERATAARERLIARYAAMETALSLANAMMEQVRAQMNASSSDS